MKIVISPAKSLNFEKELPLHNIRNLLSKRIKTNPECWSNNPKDLSALMDISDKLAWTGNAIKIENLTPENARPAVYAFDGDYTGLDGYSIPTEKIENLQDSLRILSGLYGVLKPLI
jgi:cytoplasmic iron level regulating protein YaaA (DUF328/UPF0246 family)